MRTRLPAPLSLSLSLALLLAAAPSALAQKNGDDVSIGKYHTITSKVLGEERTVLIHLPEGYETSTDKVPVLYVLGGSAGALVEGVQATSQRGVPPMIVVAIATTGYRLNSRPRPQRHTQLFVVYGDKEMPDVREGLAKYRPLLEALRSDTLSMTIEDLPQETHVPSNSLSKGLKQVFDGYLYPYERLAKEGLPALESHCEQLSRRLGFRVPVPGLDLGRLTLFLLEDGRSADLRALARALERANAEGRLHVADPGGLVHLVLVVAHFRANEMDPMKEHYRLMQLPQGWTPPVPEWPKIVEAAKGGKSDPPGPRKRPATGPAMR